MKISYINKDNGMSTTKSTYRPFGKGLVPAGSIIALCEIPPNQGRQSTPTSQLALLYGRNCYNRYAYKI